MSADLRSRLLARIAELREVAGDAVDVARTRWRAYETGDHDWAVRGRIRVASALYGEHARHIAAHDPSLMAGLWEWLTAEVRRHEYERLRAVTKCRGCVGEPIFANDDDCPAILRWAAVLGVGDGGTGERGTPVAVMACCGVLPESDGTVEHASDCPASASPPPAAPEVAGTAHQTRDPACSRRAKGERTDLFVICPVCSASPAAPLLGRPGDGEVPGV